MCEALEIIWFDSTLERLWGRAGKGQGTEGVSEPDQRAEGGVTMFPPGTQVPACYCKPVRVDIPLLQCN